MGTMDSEGANVADEGFKQEFLALGIGSFCLGSAALLTDTGGAIYNDLVRGRTGC